jgi:hypothetical protein
MLMGLIAKAAHYFHYYGNAWRENQPNGGNAILLKNNSETIIYYYT